MVPDHCSEVSRNLAGAGSGLQFVKNATSAKLRKVRSASTSQVGLEAMTGILRHRKRPRGDGSRGWGDVATGQGHWSAQKLGEAGGTLGALRGGTAPPHRGLKDAWAQNQDGIGSVV